MSFFQSYNSSVIINFRKKDCWNFGNKFYGRKIASGSLLEFENDGNYEKEKQWKKKWYMAFLSSSSSPSKKSVVKVLVIFDELLPIVDCPSHVKSILFNIHIS